ncbi:MAG: hypothetical protein LC731_03960, partial [Acidobacteria bacterium]|nr:hypothetical protein [Acidobacteriota bacterium]
ITKMMEALRLRSEQARSGSRESVRVIINAQSGAGAENARLALQNAGATLKGQMDSLGMMVADVPVEKLSTIAERDEINWMSQDQPVRSLAATNNTSHLEISTGASRVLPTTNEGLASGGGGNKVGIAILDSGISPPDTAEFAGYEWKQSSGTLGTGLFSQTYLSTYDRIRRRVDFTGEARKGAHAHLHQPIEQTRKFCSQVILQFKKGKSKKAKSKSEEKKERARSSIPSPFYIRLRFDRGP